MRKGVILAVVLAFAMMRFASAAIDISSAGQIYTYGDQLNFNVSISESSATNDFLTVSLACNGDSSEIYRAPVNVKAGQQVNVSVTAFADSAVFGSLGGACNLRANYNGEQSSSDSFRISNNVFVNVQTAGNLFGPSDTISVSGNASRADGNPVNGTFSATLNSSISGNSLSVTGDITNGVFAFNFNLPADFPAGAYAVRVAAQDSDDAGNTLNYGTGSAAVRVKQVITQMDIALSDVNITPGNSTTYRIVMYDQSSAEADSEVSVSFYRPDGSLLQSTVIPSYSFETFNVSSDYAPGSWTIAAQTGNFNASRQFDVAEYAAINTSVYNSTLIVTNMGNIPYVRVAQLTVGESTRNIQLNVPVDGQQVFSVSAPDGTYNLELSDGLTSQSLPGVSLTGNAVAVTDLSGNSSGVSWTFVFWGVLIIIGLGVAIYYYRRLSRNGAFTGTFSRSAKVERTKTLSSIVAQRNSQNAQGGERTEAAVIVLKIKNYSELSRITGPANESIAQAERIAKGAKAVITNGDAYHLMYFFSPNVIGNKELVAVKVAKQIESVLKSHNRKYSRKIMFGIGVHTDTFIAENSGGAWHFTPLGTALSHAKKMAEQAAETVLVSDNVHEKTRAQVKVDKDIGGMFWNVRSIAAERSGEHEEFLKRFLKSNKFE